MQNTLEKNRKCCNSSFSEFSEMLPLLSFTASQIHSQQSPKGHFKFASHFKWQSVENWTEVDFWSKIFHVVQNKKHSAAALDVCCHGNRNMNSASAEPGLVSILSLLGNVLPCGYICPIHELRCESSAPLMETRWDLPWFSERGEDVER